MSDITTTADGAEWQPITDDLWGTQDCDVLKIAVSPCEMSHGHGVVFFPEEIDRLIEWLQSVKARSQNCPECKGARGGAGIGGGWSPCNTCGGDGVISTEEATA